MDIQATGGRTLRVDQVGHGYWIRDITQGGIVRGGEKGQVPLAKVYVKKPDGQYGYLEAASSEVQQKLVQKLAELGAIPQEGKENEVQSLLER